MGCPSTKLDSIPQNVHVFKAQDSLADLTQHIPPEGWKETSRPTESNRGHWESRGDQADSLAPSEQRQIAIRFRS